MFRRTLPRDAVLWWRGDAAETIGVVDRGRAGIRSHQGLLDVAVAGTAVGETALLGASVTRAHDVVALDDDTVVIEYTVAEVSGALEGGVPHLVLRTLVGQIGRNHLLVAAAHPATAGWRRSPRALSRRWWPRPAPRAPSRRGRTSWSRSAASCTCARARTACATRWPRPAPGRPSRRSPSSRASTSGCRRRSSSPRSSFRARDPRAS